MNGRMFFKTRLYCTGIATIAIGSLLIWNHYHGGVPSHHILARNTTMIAEIPGYMLIGVFILALFFSIYKAECILGFVIGMTYTFGAVIPTGVGSLLALFGMALYLGIRPVALYITTQVQHFETSNPSKHNGK